jgi:ribosome maturation factor RimP
MKYSAKAEQGPELNALRTPLEGILWGLGLQLIDMSVSRRAGRKNAPGTVQVRVVVYNGGSLGIDECSKAHRAILPRLELAFPENDLYVEVSSPGIDRLIKDGVEFTHYMGRGVRCYCTDISDWRAGILKSSDEKGIELKTIEGTMRLNYEIIAKAKLDSSQEGV